MHHKNRLFLIPSRLGAPYLWLLALLLMSYVCAGFFIRDPWKNDDLIYFARLYQFSIYDWHSMLDGAAFYKESQNYLYYYLGGAWVKIANSIGISAKISIHAYSVFFMCASIAMLYKIMRKVTQDDDLQPIQHPLSLNASFGHYQQTMAWGAVWMSICQTGAIFYLHESTIYLAHMAYVAFFIWAIVVRRWYATCLAFMLILSATDVALLIASIWVYIYHRQHPWRVLLVGICTSFLLVSYTQYLPHWGGVWNGLNLHPSILMQRMADIVYRYPGFMWPIVPLALVSLLQFTSKSIRFCAFASMAYGLCIFSQEYQRSSFLYTLPSMSILAVFGAVFLSTHMRRMLQKFTHTVFITLMVVLILIAVLWQNPFQWMSTPIYVVDYLKHVNQLIPPSIWGLVFALLLMYTGFMYHIHTDREKILYPLMQWAIGLNITWWILLIFYMPAINQIKSYQPIIHMFNWYIGQNNCAHIAPMPRAQQAALIVDSKFLIPELLPIKTQQNCLYQIRYQQNIYSNKKILLNDHDDATVVWQGHRIAEPQERFTLIQLKH